MTRTAGNNPANQMMGAATAKCRDAGMSTFGKPIPSTHCYPDWHQQPIQSLWQLFVAQKTYCLFSYA